MAVTLATATAYALPAELVEVTMTAGGASANYARVWVTDAPEGSEYRKALDAATTATRVQVAEAFETDDNLQLKMEVGGAYTFQAQEYTKGAAPAFGGGYDADPEGYATETKVGGEDTITLYVGQHLTSRVGAPGYGFATLNLWVWNATIRATNNTAHAAAGITPSITGPSNDKAKTAAQAVTVATALAAMVDITAATALGSPNLVVAELAADIAAHMNNTGGTGSHGTVDSDNDTDLEHLPLTPLPSTPVGYAISMSVIAPALRRHMQNQPGTAGQYHRDYDYTNLPVATVPGSESNMWTVMASVADTYRAYEAHRQDAVAHLAADGLNTITATLGPLLVLHRDFITAMTPAVPTVPTGMNPAVTTLVHTAGFEEAI